MMNFIFIMSDSFRFDLLECYTHIRPRLRTRARVIETPNLDRFASQSTIFDCNYLGSYPTVPNRKDIFTGQLRRFNRWAALKDDEQTFISELRKAGYVTQMITDTPHTVKTNFNFARDFNAWDWVRGQEGDHYNCDVEPLQGDVDKFRHSGLPQHKANVRLLGRRYENECFCAQTFSRGAQWLERHYQSRKPFFLYLDTFDPHEPWDAPQWYVDYYDPDYRGEDFNYPIYAKCGAYTKEELNHIRAMYAAEATLVDRWLGHLLETV